MSLRPLLAPFAIALVAALQPGMSQAAALAAGQGKTVQITTPLRLNAQQLLSMKAGEKVSIFFPVIGRKTVVYESTAKGLDGISYWHGRLDGSPLDRVMLKREKDGFVGAVRLAGQQYAFTQEADGTLAAAKDLPPAAAQAYRLTPTATPGVSEVEGHFASVAQAQVGSEIALPLPNGQTEVMVVTGSGADEHGFYQVSGVSRLDGQAFPTLITVGTDATFGTIMSSKGEYQIVTRHGKTEIVDPKAAGWSQVRGEDQAAASDEPASAAALVKFKKTTSATTTTATTATTTTSTAATTASLTPLPAGTVDTTINVLMSYSPSYVAQWGTETIARTRLSNLVQVANSAYANSGTGIRFKITGWQLVQQADATPQTNLPNMRSGSGGFSVLPGKKSTSGAAVTVYFSPFNATTGSTGTCGLAYVPGAGSGGVSAYANQAPTTLYASLNDGQWNSSYCEVLSLAHELGHTLGAVHDKANSSFTGTFSYSYGKGISGVFGDVMSYVSPRVALFSSPQLTCATNQPCGSSTENVVATMLQTKAYAARLGNATAAAVTTDGTTVTAGWLVQSSGAPYTGAATIKPTNAAVTCTSGKTGLYICNVPSTVSSVTVGVGVTGRIVIPTSGTYSVNRLSNTPIVGTRFTVQ